MRRIRAERGEDTLPILIRRAAQPPEVTLMLRAGFVFLMVAAVGLLYAFPAIITWLPQRMVG